MLRWLFCFIAIFEAFLFSFGQRIEETYPKVLWSENDSFSVKFSYVNHVNYFSIGKKDTIGMGGDGVPNLYVTIHHGKDSLIVKYKNLPFEQVNWMTFQSPKGKTVYRLHFNQLMAGFTDEYIKTSNGSIRYEIPEVYELANIIWILSPSGQRAEGLNKNGNYYNRLFSWFKPFLNHPIFKELNFPDSVYYENYYDFRENSLAFNFKNNKLAWGDPYYYVTGNDGKTFNSLFKKLAPLAEDFANKSNFRTFYKSNFNYYSSQIKSQKQLMPVSNMWKWLEENFPNRLNSYKLVFSPLIGNSHSTQKFAGISSGKFYYEAVMFLPAPSYYDTLKQATQEIRQALASGIVFTEIDHNYVNPVSFKYQKSIDSIFLNRDLWVRTKVSKLYVDPISVFNEYMTHAVFCLWILENYDQQTANYVINKRATLMTEGRGFKKFKEFTAQLIALRKDNNKFKIAELYPFLLEWCKKQTL